MFNCAILGYGTVGCGVYRLITEKADALSRRSSVPINVKWVLDRRFRRAKDFPLPDAVRVTDPDIIFNDPEVDCIIELIGGVEPAREYILRAIEAGKHVVTANKAVLSSHGPEIWKRLREKGVLMGFEASVGGCIPVIKTIKETLVANKISEIIGIMNGTSNYILSNMTHKGASYEDALKMAQQLGYAEADPRFDVEGYDTAHKLIILGMLIFGINFNEEELYIEGITGIDPIDINIAKELGFRIRLLAIGAESNGSVMLRVHPAMIPEAHLLSQVEGAYNAFYIKGDEVGTMLLYGMGAGEGPTASTVVGDVVDIARAGEARGGQCLRHNSMHGNIDNCISGPILSQRSSLKKAAIDFLSSRYYFRFSALDKPGVLAAISGVLGRHGISVQSVVQKGRSKSGVVPIVMLTHEAIEASVRQALIEIDSLTVTRAKTVLIRIEDEVEDV